MHQHDELYVVSDLHLGGEPGFQIFDLGDTLAGLIDYAASRPADKNVAFVINGDFVDFLAESPASHFDPVGATTKLKRIVEDPAFEPVFAALGRFAATVNRTLVIVLGNHDIELALPETRRYLSEVLARRDTAAKGRIEFCFDNAGYACRVEGRRVLCVHGNSVDDWNRIDAGRLASLAQSLNAGHSIDPWVPNAGTQLVIDLMNDVKKEFPFVDLLKPERAPVVSILAVLKPTLFARIKKLAGALSTLMGEKLTSEVKFRSGPVSPADVLGMDREIWNYLETSQAVLRGADDPKGRELLRRALRVFLRGDKTFEIDTWDDTAKDLDKEIGADIDLVIAGHTHLERALARTVGEGFYLNTGTWARLIRLTEAQLETAEAFAPVAAALADGSMEALDGLVERRPSLAVVRPEGDALVAGIARATRVGDRVEPVMVKSTRLELT